MPKHKRMVGGKGGYLRVEFSPEVLNLAKEKNIAPEEALAELRRVHILLEHDKDKIIWVRCEE